MNKRLRYGDEGTQVTARETVVAILFTIGIVALLVVRGALGSDDGPATATTRPAGAPQSVAQSVFPEDPAAGVAHAGPTPRHHLPGQPVPASTAADAAR